MSSGFADNPHDGSDYIGPATIVVHDMEIPVRVELRGYREPIDGIFRWFGRIQPSDDLEAALGDEKRTRVTIRTEHSAREGFVGDPDPWRRLRIMGKSTPPFHVPTELSEVE
ncbi:DUF4873 domain-containing protein [Nocardia sp. GCM10030253]|uniref:DUF4873 domain-containing protein n=1 Tax=Nocardia sp. GCM10030253 TaxID=3273404 RepID=UPI003633B0FC